MVVEIAAVDKVAQNPFRQLGFFFVISKDINNQLLSDLFIYLFFGRFLAVHFFLPSLFFFIFSCLALWDIFGV